MDLTGRRRWMRRALGPGRCSPRAVRHFLVHDLQLLREEENAPVGVWGSAQQAAFLMRLRGLFGIHRMGHLARVSQRGSEPAATNLRYLLAASRPPGDDDDDAPVLFPVEWSVDDRPGHIGLLVVHYPSRSLAVWDPADHRGLGDEQLIAAQGLDFDVTPGLAPRPPVLQALFEPPGQAPLHPCMATTTAVLLCALRFRCPHVWRLSETLAVVIRRFTVAQRRHMVRNLAVLVRRGSSARFEGAGRPLARLLGLWRGGGGRRATRCGVLGAPPSSPSGPCRALSDPRSPLCPGHLAPLLRRWGPGREPGGGGAGRGAPPGAIDECLFLSDWYGARGLRCAERRVPGQ